MELARGKVVDRPWGLTLAAVHARRVTGQLVLHTKHAQFSIVFDQGEIVDATSPLMGDSVTSIAVIDGIAPAARFAELTRLLAEAPDHDEIEVLAGALRLAPDQARHLRHRIVEQRAARTFSIEDGMFVIEAAGLRAAPICARVDLRRVIYLGAWMYRSRTALADDLRPFGSRFVLEPSAAAELSGFGFTRAERPVLDALQRGATLAELDASCDLDPHVVRAALYALLACSACVPAGRTARGSTPPTSGSARPRGSAPPRAAAPSAMTAGARSTPVRRRTAAGSTPPPAPVTAPRQVDATTEAREAFRRGLSALRADELDHAIAELARAVELIPNDVDFRATLAWALFCVAPDKLAAADAARIELRRAIYRSPAPEFARFYLGRVERMLGHDREALRHFHEVLALQPTHADAEIEVRMIEARLSPPGKRRRARRAEL